MPSRRHNWQTGSRFRPIESINLKFKGQGLGVKTGVFRQSGDRKPMVVIRDAFSGADNRYGAKG